MYEYVCQPTHFTLTPCVTWTSKFALLKQNRRNSLIHFESKEHAHTTFPTNESQNSSLEDSSTNTTEKQKQLNSFSSFLLIFHFQLLYCFHNRVGTWIRKIIFCEQTWCLHRWHKYTYDKKRKENNTHERRKHTHRKIYTYTKTNTFTINIWNTFLLNSSNQDFPYLCYAHEEGLPKRTDEREEVNGYEKSNDNPTPSFLSRTRTT